VLCADQKRHYERYRALGVLVLPSSDYIGDMCVRRTWMSCGRSAPTTNADKFLCG
jgi:hypothetical protein